MKWNTITILMCMFRKKIISLDYRKKGDKMRKKNTNKVTLGGEVRLTKEAQQRVRHSWLYQGSEDRHNDIQSWKKTATKNREKCDDLKEARLRKAREQADLLESNRNQARRAHAAYQKLKMVKP